MIDRHHGELVCDDTTMPSGGLDTFGASEGRLTARYRSANFSRTRNAWRRASRLPWLARNGRRRDGAVRVARLRPPAPRLQPGARRQRHARHRRGALPKAERRRLRFDGRGTPARKRQRIRHRPRCRRAGLRAAPLHRVQGEWRPASSPWRLDVTPPTSNVTSPSRIQKPATIGTAAEVARTRLPGIGSVTLVVTRASKVPQDRLRTVRSESMDMQGFQACPRSG
jgi:hypothetical protein